VAGRLDAILVVEFLRVVLNQILRDEGSLRDQPIKRQESDSELLAGNFDDKGPSFRKNLHRLCALRVTRKSPA
jgi:hypothetical protein